ncbi:radical SAM family heme chaperone HemW [Halocola ammonii]
MAGIYIHIPFCKQACHYCDFHFSTSLKQRTELVESIRRELELRKGYLNDQPVETIYFGGGTPSLLNPQELQSILDKVYELFPVTENPEITLEANPDDLSEEKLKELEALPINRLSIGIQSFRADDLKMMNRAHDVEQALTCVPSARNHGFKNISIDLIYGIPGLTNEEWKANLQQAFDLKPDHISSYCLTIEPGTAFAHFVKKGKLNPVDEEMAANQFEIMVKAMKENGFDHYEVSNFGKAEFYSRHNTSYWLSKHYLGVGPSAHSFDGKSRSWNVANNSRYIKSLEKDGLPIETEELSLNTQYNEYILTSLRTIWGVSVEKMKTEFEVDFEEKFANELKRFKDEGWIKKQADTWKVTEEGMLMADGIAAEFFIIES